jgi:hypothetical protein
MSEVSEIVEVDSPSFDPTWLLTNPEFPVAAL